MTPQQILLDAADLIERDGWIQGQFRAKGGFCVVGAIDAVSLTARHPASRRDVEELLALTIRCHADRITVWNDHPLRTKAEVIAALRDAARQAGVTNG